MAKKPQRATLLKQMQLIQSQLLEVAAIEENQAGKLARKSGLLDIDLTDAQLLEGFKELAVKFRKAPGEKAAAHTPPKD